MSSARTAAVLQIVTFVTGLLLPTITLLPLGSLWLWEHGLLLHWAVLCAALVGVAHILQRRAFNRVGREPASEAAGAEMAVAGDAPESSWTPAEELAWASVVRISRSFDPEKLTSREAVIALGTDTIQAVARTLHPEVKEPLWQFTVPEAFAIAEQVSRRLGAFTVDHVPLSDRLTVAQVLSLYRWRGAIDVGEKAYNAWRLIRVINPMTAATNELRERLAQQILQRGRTHVTRRLAGAYVKEVGRAAIDLYGGRLHVSARPEPVDLSPGAGAAPADIALHKGEPLRILIAGQAGSGKSSLINALGLEVKATIHVLPGASGVTFYEFSQSGFPSAHLIAAPSLGGSDREQEITIETAIGCDLILWLVAAHRGDRQADVRALTALNEAFKGRPNRKRPPVVTVLTHIDRLLPAREWSPPYDLRTQDQPKAVAIHDAIDAAALDLGIEANQIIPVSLGDGRFYNVDALLSRMAMVLPEAQQAQLVRRIVANRSKWNWRKVWSQAVGGGRIAGRTLLRRR